MDAKHILETLQEEIKADKLELEQAEILIKVARLAGESVTDLEQEQRSVLMSIEKWEKAIKATLGK